MQRTMNQNRALHLWAEMLAAELNGAGLDMKAVLKPTVDIPWSKDTVKEYLIKPVMKAQVLKEHTADLDRAELTELVETLNRHLGEKFSIHVPFPTHENKPCDDML